MVVTWPYARPFPRPLVRPHHREIFQFLASLEACNLILHIHVVVNWQLSKQYPLTGITVPYRGISCQRSQLAWFLKLSADKLLVFSDHRPKFKFLMHRKYLCCVYEPHYFFWCTYKTINSMYMWDLFHSWTVLTISPIYFSLKSPSLSLKSKVIWFVDLFTSLLFDLNYKFTNASFAFSPG